MEKNKHKLAVIFLSLAILTRELALPIYAAVLAYFFLKLDFKKLFKYSFAIIPFLIWEFVLILQTGTVPLLISFYSLTKPFMGVLGYFINFPSFIFDNIINPISSNAVSIFSVDFLRPLNKIFSPLPLVIFSLILLFIMVVYFLKDKKITVYGVVLLSQIAMLMSLKGYFFFNLEIDAVGRYAMGMFLFSLIYFAEKKQKYNMLLIILMVLMSLSYFIVKIIVFSTNYYIT